VSYSGAIKLVLLDSGAMAAVPPTQVGSCAGVTAFWRLGEMVGHIRVGCRLVGVST
jgi:hypothetical protein